MTTAQRTFLAILLGLVASRVAAEEPRACLPEDLRLRLAWSDPGRIATALKEIEAAKKRADKRAVLARRLRDAGCATVAEEGGPGLRAPNLVCRLPGRTSATIAIGTSPQVDGWLSAALLPEVARAVASAPREHTFLLAVFARASEEIPAGATALADSLRTDPPHLFVHYGWLGARPLEIGPEADATQRCIAQSTARSLGVAAEVRPSWPTVASNCNLRPAATSVRGSPSGPFANGVLQCIPTTLGLSLDTRPFLRRGVPVVGWYALSGKRRRASTRESAASLLETYKVLAAHAVALDQALAAPPGAAGTP